MNENENIKKDNAELEQPKQYDFDKNTFVVNLFSKKTQPILWARFCSVL